MTELFDTALLAAKQASAVILQHYQQREQLTIQTKADSTPVTQADIAADAILQSILSKSYPVLSEESAVTPYRERQQWQRYWLVDPIDGTKEFIAGTGEFCICIALIEQHRPVLGLIYLPISQEYYYAYDGSAAYKYSAGQCQAIHCHGLNGEAINVMMSRRHGKKRFLAFLANRKQYQILHQGSAIKFGKIAEGKADIYPRFGPSCEWDTAAGQCIVEAAGGNVMDLQGNVLEYNTKASLLNPEFIAVGDAQQQWFTTEE